MEDSDDENVEPTHHEGQWPLNDGKCVNEVSTIEEANAPSESPLKNDLALLEAETSEILQRYGKSRLGPRCSRRLSSPPPCSPASKPVGNGRPLTQASAFNHGSCRVESRHGTKKSIDKRSFTSSIRKQATAASVDNILDDECKMFKADGTAKNLLRDTISTALSISQFDSVSSLLASGKSQGDVQVGKFRDHQSLNSPFLKETSPHMVSVMSLTNVPATKTSLQDQPFREGTSDPTKPKSLTLRNIKYTGFDKSSAVSDGQNTEDKSQHDPKDDQKEKNATKPEREVCFNCWSAGEGYKCLIHKEKSRKMSSSKSEQNVSMCGKWKIGYLRRKYRAEEIQERFSQQSQSLMFDRAQKQFHTFEEPKHPIYRLVSQHIIRFNFTYQRRQNVRIWFRSFIDKLKEGKVPGKRSTTSAGILRLKGTISNLVAVKKLSTSVAHLHPKAPVTGRTMRERLGQEHVLVEKDIAVGSVIKKKTFRIAGPAPIPNALYRPRKYEPLPPQKFLFNKGQSCNAVLQNESEGLAGLDFSSIILNFSQYATFGRKSAKENLAVGGLSAEMLVSQQFTAIIPPQYKNFTAIYDSILMPPRNDDITSTFPTLVVPPGELPYIRRELVTPLDKRLPPTVMTKTGIGRYDRHFFGLNRPEQTGEEGDFGFPTSTWVPMPSFDDKIDTNSFRPSDSVATPNLPQLSPMRTTLVDKTYPFRKEQSRTNTVNDIFHLLLSNGDCSRNKLQMFTCIGSQQPGYFMQNGDSSLPIGRVVTKVVRTWAFLQDDPIDMTPEGSKPDENQMVYKEETKLLSLGGVLFNNRPRYARSMPSGVLTSLSRADVRKVILRKTKQETDPENDCAVSPAMETKSLIKKMESRHIVTEDGGAGTRTDSNVEKTGKLSTETTADLRSSYAHVEQKMDKDGLGVTENKKSAMSETDSVQFKEALIANSISQVIGESLKSFANKPEDLIRLGMGIGASLGAQGFFKSNQVQQCEAESGARKMSDHGGTKKTFSDGTKRSSPIPDIGSIQVQPATNQQPPLEETHKTTDDLVLNTSEVNGIEIEECKQECELELTTNAGIEIYESEAGQFNDVKTEQNFVNFSKGTTKGLLGIVAAKRVGTRHAHYLPFDFNLPDPRNIDTKKARSHAQDCLKEGYDPWSAGKEPTSSQFIRSLSHEMHKWPKRNNNAEEPATNNNEKEFATLCSFVRHGKYRELEDMINNPDWTLPIDYCDDSGNTLLMIACQNGNRRIAKLCLRRGSHINKRNLNGNSCLHFAFGYGFGELGDYLISKGADDSIQNVNGLTCYEGLEMTEL